MAWEASASGDVTAVAGIGYLTYTDTAARNVNLPAGVVGESVGINDVSQNCGTNSITIITSGSEKFMGLVENFILDIDGSSIIATYADVTNGWVITGGNIARLPIVADVLTGNIQGLEYSYTSAHSITVTKGNCFDSLNTTILTGSASQAVAIGTTINQIYNLFLCDDGLVKTDTDVEGATLLAGAVTALRWIGFVLTDASGEVYDFRMKGRELYITRPFAIGSPLTNSAVVYSLSAFIPETRVDNTRLYVYSYDILKSYCSFVDETPRAVFADMGGIFDIPGGLSPVLYTNWIGTLTPKLFSVTLKR